MSFWRGLFAGAQDTGPNIANAVMMKRQREREDALREKQWAREDTQAETAEERLLNRLGMQFNNQLALQNDQQDFTGKQNQMGRTFQQGMQERGFQHDVDMAGLSHTQRLGIIGQEFENAKQLLEQKNIYSEKAAEALREWQGLMAQNSQDFERTQNELDRGLKTQGMEQDATYRDKALKMQRDSAILSSLVNLIGIAGDDEAMLEQIKVVGQKILTGGPSESTDNDVIDINKQLSQILGGDSPTVSPTSTEPATPPESPASRLGIKADDENEWSRLNNYSVGYKVDPKIQRWLDENFKASWDAPYYSWDK